MVYLMIDMQGFDPKDLFKLIGLGIESTEDVLRAAGTYRGRNKLHELTGIPVSELLRMVNRADLTRLPGVGLRISELMERVGVVTLKKLRHRNPGRLYKLMYEENERCLLCKRAPTLRAVTDFVRAAQETPTRITY